MRFFTINSYGKKRTPGIILWGFFILICQGVLHAQDPFASLGYAYEKTITIDHDQVSGISDLIDYPLLVKLIDPDLADVLNGGHVGKCDRNGHCFH